MPASNEDSQTNQDCRPVTSSAVVQKAIHFNGLNELRALAALAVVFHHVERHKHLSGRASLYDTALNSFIDDLGSNAVWLFFVLSGFLITYLLLKEYNETGDIRIRHFYIRRVLRIWPLYYLIVMLAVCLFPAMIDLFPQPAAGAGVYGNAGLAEGNRVAALLLFVFLLPNLALILFGPVAGATQTWSIGSEEQFYLLWPLIVRYFSANFARTLLLVILIKLLLQVLAFYVGNSYEIPMFVILGKFLLTLRIELMAIGAFCAFGLLHFKSRMVRLLTSRMCQLLVIGLIATLMLRQSGVGYLLLGCGFGYVIMSATVQGGIPLRSTLLDQLGRISYGIYMYHPVVIIMVFGTVHWLEITDPILYNSIVYLAVLSITLGVSILSYRCFESIFQRMKARFSTTPEPCLRPSPRSEATM